MSTKTIDAKQIVATALDLAETNARAYNGLIEDFANLLALVETLLPAVDAQRLPAAAQNAYTSALADVPRATRAIAAVRERSTRTFIEVVNLRAAFKAHGRLTSTSTTRMH